MSDLSSRCFAEVVNWVVKEGCEGIANKLKALTGVGGSWGDFEPGRFYQIIYRAHKYFMECLNGSFGKPETEIYYFWYVSVRTAIECCY